MARQRPYCCRTRVRIFFTLSLAAGVSLFLFNVISQVLDIPPSSGAGDLQDNFFRRHEIINGWRKERLAQKNEPVIAPVPCKGKKCKKFMGVLGLDGKAGGGAVLQHCKHPLFLSEDDSSATSIPPLKCLVPEEYHCGYDKGEITVAANWSCLLQPFRRLDSNDSAVVYTSHRLITESVSLQKLEPNDDYFRLSCVPNKHLAAIYGGNTIKKLISLAEKRKANEQHFFTRIAKYPEGELEPCQTDRCLPYNVLVLGVGSLSQTSFRRLLPKTYSYFTTSLQSVKFDGYNVVGDGASGALLPLLTGLDETHQQEARINKQNSHYMDRLELLWNAYDQHGYATLYAEDHPSSNTFNDRFQGFERPPTTHYMRPFWLATESHLSKQFCLGKKPKHQYLLDYLLDFFSTYSSDRRFALAMLKELTHSDVALAQHLDDDLLKFLKSMSPYLDDTFIVLMTDHGLQSLQSIRNGQTKVQSRMPLLSIYLPTSFIKNYSDLAHAMIANEDKLVTPYDIHHTLKDIIDIQRIGNADPRDDGKFGQSLFKPLAIDRTCQSAGVAIHWCACHTQLKVELEQGDQQKMKEIALAELNMLSSTYRDQCKAYSSITILTLSRIVPNEQIAEYEALNNKLFTADTQLKQNYYQLTFEAKTSESADIADSYEVTFEHNDSSGLLGTFTKSYTLVSEIIRLNKSKARSCAVDKDIIRYCSCVKP